MKVLVHFLVVGAILIFKGTFCSYCRVEIGLTDQWKQHSKMTYPKCCIITNEQWNLISWYFLRVGSYVDVTEIFREKDSANQNLYMSHFVKDLYRYTNLSYHTHRLCYCDSDEVSELKDPDGNAYQWHPELSKHGNSTYYIEEEKLNIRSQLLKRKWTREDEPEKGIVVLASDITIIDHFLNGVSRPPFQSKRAYYIILIYRSIDSNWDQYASSILSKLWKVHGILNAIILASCKHKNVGIYDTFANTRHMNISDETIDEWGIYRCFPIKYLDFTDNWLVQKAYGLNGFPLTVSVFERFPTMVREVPKYFAETQYARGMKTSGFGGIDGILLGNVANDMEFTVNTITPKDDDGYGYKFKGKFTGSIGDVLYGRADIAFNSRFLINYQTTDIEYMVPILGDKVCVVLPATLKAPQWKAIFNCYDIYFWYTFLIITAISSIVFAVLKYYIEKQDRRVLRDSIFYKDYKNVIVEDKIRVKDILVATWKVMVGMNAILPLRSVERLLIGSCIVANIIIRGSFESSLYNSYTKTSGRNIDTLRELDTSGLKIVVGSPALKLTFGNYQSNSEVLLSLKGKLLLQFRGTSAIERVAESRDVCSIERYSDLHIIIMTKFLRQDGVSKLHVLKECPRHHFLTYIVYKDWPLLYRFNKVLLRLAEGGFATLWYDKMEEAFIRSAYHENHLQLAKNHRKPFSLYDIQTSFYILLFGYALSIIAFLVERFVVPPEKLRKFKNRLFPIESIMNEFQSSRRKQRNKLFVGNRNSLVK